MLLKLIYERDKWHFRRSYYLSLVQMEKLKKIDKWISHELSDKQEK